MGHRYCHDPLTELQARRCLGAAWPGVPWCPPVVLGPAHFTRGVRPYVPARVAPLGHRWFDRFAGLLQAACAAPWPQTRHTPKTSRAGECRPCCSHHYLGQLEGYLVRWS